MLSIKQIAKYNIPNIMTWTIKNENSFWSYIASAGDQPA